MSKWAQRTSDMTGCITVQHNCFIVGKRTVAAVSKGEDSPKDFASLVTCHR